MKTARKNILEERERIMDLLKGFSWKRALGISSAKSKFARATGIPTTKQGRKRKAKTLLWNMLFGKPKHKSKRR